MPSLDLPDTYNLGMGYGGDATALADPASQALMEKRRRDAQADTLAQVQLEQHQMALAHERAQNAQEQDRQTAQTMVGEMPTWTENPRYQTSWANLPSETRTHFIDAYGNLASQAPAAWNQTVQERLGKPVGMENLPPNTTATADIGGLKITTKPPSQTLRNLAAHEGVTTTPDMSDEDIQTARAARAGEAQSKKDELAEKRLTQADARTKVFARRQINQITNSAPVRMFYAAKANFDSMKQNVAAKNRNGADDVFLIKAAANIEAPGRSPTVEDVHEIMRGIGIVNPAIADRLWGMMNSGADAQAKAGRIIPDYAAKQLLEASRRSVAERRKQFDDVIAPAIDIAVSAGMEPEKAIYKGIYKDEFTEGENQQTAVPTEYQDALNWLNKPENRNSPHRAGVESRLRAAGVIQ